MTQIVAQDSYCHEFSVYGGAGASTFRYSPSIGSKSSGLGGQFGLDYTYFFSPEWGVGTGVEMAFYNAKTIIDNLGNKFLITTPASLPANSDFYLQTNHRNYTETQKAGYVNIPILLHYQSGEKNKFYLTGGIKLGLPLSASYAISSDLLTTTGYSDYTYQVYENIPLHGFSDYPDIASSGKPDLNTVYIATLETGVKWRLNEHVSLYTGLYLDYGFNDVRKNKAEKSMVIPNETNPTDYGYNSLLESQIDGTEIAANVSPFSFGLKLRFSFGSGQSRKRANASEEMDIYKETVVVQTNEASKQKEQADLFAATTEIARDVARNEVLSLREEVYQHDMELLLRTINNYNKGDSELNYYQQLLMDEKVRILKRYPDINILVEGHTCNTGSGEINQKMGQQRADKAKDYLISKGIPATRINTENKESYCPVVPNNNETNRKQNRRVEFKLLMR
jgi:outer membrane protein OmpA-like peptidoglycan-associated protein